jgi:hypothetical protein
MSREAKFIDCGRSEQAQSVYDYESFGWELSDAQADRIIMSRETQNPVYPELVRFQERYEALQNEINLKNAEFAKNKKPVRVNGWVLAALFILLILPFVVYMLVYGLKNKKYKAVEKKHLDETSVLTAEKIRIAKESRETFFSRQNLKALYNKNDKDDTELIFESAEIAGADNDPPGSDLK